MSEQAGYVVVDIWRAKPGKAAAVEAILRQSGPRFRDVEGIISVDYTRLEDADDQYLVIFRYVDKEARERFARSDLLKETMAALMQVWDLESPIFRGTGFGV